MKKKEIVYNKLKTFNKNMTAIILTSLIFGIPVIIEYFKLNNPDQNQKITTSFTEGLKKEDIINIKCSSDFRILRRFLK